MVQCFCILIYFNQALQEMTLCINLYWKLWICVSYTSDIANYIGYYIDCKTKYDKVDHEYR